TLSTVRPVTGVSSWIRVRAGKTDSKRRISRPASARLSVRAARKIVSPSGILVVVPSQRRERRRPQRRPPRRRRWTRRRRGRPEGGRTRRRPRHLEPHRRRMEARFHEVRRERMVRGLLPVDLREQQAAALFIARQAGQGGGE